MSLSREEKISFIKQKTEAAEQQVASGNISRNEKINFIQSKLSNAKPSLGSEGRSALMDGFMEVVDTIDSYTGAPTRAAISAAQNTKNPFTAFYNQFGEDPSTAPTGKEIVRKAGVPDTALSDVAPSLYSEDGNEWLKFKKGGPLDVTASGAAGLAMDLAADPTNFVPAAAISKTMRGTGKVAEKSADILKNAPGVESLSKSLDAVKGSVTDSAEAIKNMFTPKQADDFQDLISIAEKNNISKDLLPDQIEFGENSFLGRAARQKAEGVLGEKSLNKFYEGLNAVQDATVKRIENISGGYIPSSIEAGEIIRSGYDKAVDRLFDNVGMTHGKVLEAIPGLKLSPEGFNKIESKLSGLEKWAKGRSSRGITNAQRAQGEQIVRAVEAVRANNGSYKQTLEALRDIGEIAFKSQNVLADVPPDVAKFRDLYGTINEALIDTVRQAAGNPAADELLESNKIISEFLGEKSVISNIVGNRNLSPEKVFASLVKNGDTNKVKALKNILAPEEFNRLKGAFLESQIRRNSDDIFTFKALHNNLRNKKNILGDLLDGSEINEINDLIRLGSRFGEPTLSSSGTGASNVFSDIYKGVRDTVANDVLIDNLKNKARKLPEGSRTRQLSSPLESKTTLDFKKGINRERLTKLATMASAGTSGASAASSNNQNKSRDNIEKGPNKWAQDGYDKVKSDLGGSARFDSLKSSRRGRDLLIRASSLKKGSKAYATVVEQLKKLNGGQDG